MSSDPSATADLSRLRLAADMLTRPFPLRPRVVWPAVALMVLLPLYLVVGSVARGWPQHMPALPLDRMIPVQPAWTVVYLSFLVIPFLPVLMIRDEEQLRRTFLAGVLVWITGYACFLVYPTVLPRSVGEVGEGFFAWFLLQVYAADVQGNCFPSLHVAGPWVAAFSCWRVHRGVGLAAGLWAGLIALSTLFTKQHYVADVVAGTALAVVAWAVFLRSSPAGVLPEPDRRAAPVLMAGLIGCFGLVVALLWVGYRLRLSPT